MNVEKHQADKHADFAHELLITSNGNEFVICCFCGHWIEQDKPECRCPASCHGMSAGREQNTRN